MSHHDETAHSQQHGTSRKTLGAYLVGFVLCIILTLIPFALVAKKALPMPTLYIALSAFALLQLFVQVFCFLRLNASPEGRWNLLSFFFTIFTVLVLVGGSYWIMYNLNYNMTN